MTYSKTDTILRLASINGWEVWEFKMRNYEDDEQYGETDNDPEFLSAMLEWPVEDSAEMDELIDAMARDLGY